MTTTSALAGRETRGKRARRRAPALATRVGGPTQRLKAALQQTVCNSGTSSLHLAAGRESAGREPRAEIWQAPVG